MGEIEQTINGVWKLWYDMECDWMVDFVNRTMRKSKIDQVLDFYWIPYIYKNDYKKYLKYRIQEKHRPVVQSHFLIVLRQDWYETDDFDYWVLQKDYCIRVPEAEATGLNLHINYDTFLKKDQEHRAALEKEAVAANNEQIKQMQDFMSSMMQEMKELKSQLGTVQDNKVLNSNNITNEWTKETSSNKDEKDWWVASVDWNNSNTTTWIGQPTKGTESIELNDWGRWENGWNEYEWMIISWNESIWWNWYDVKERWKKDWRNW